MVTLRRAWQADVERFIRAAVQLQALDVEAHLNDVRLHVADLLQDAEIRIRVDRPTLVAILASGTYDTAFQHSREPRWPTELTDRARVESALWEEYSGDVAVIEPRPRYGYLLDADESTLPADHYLIKHLAGTYGDVLLHLSDRLNESTTFMFGDSMAVTNCGRIPQIASSFRSSPHWASADFRGNRNPLDIKTLESSPLYYVEAQLHCPITVDDIERITVWFEPDKDLQNSLQHADLSVEVVRNV